MKKEEKEIFQNDVRVLLELRNHVHQLLPVHRIVFHHHHFLHPDTTTKNGKKNLCCSRPLYLPFYLVNFRSSEE